MVEAAKLTIDVEAKGTAETEAELMALDKAIDQVGDDSLGASDGVGGLGSSIDGLGSSSAGALPEILKLGAGWTYIGTQAAPLVPIISTLGATIGGLGAAVPGLVGLGGAFAYVGRNALLTSTHTDNLADAFKKLTAEGTPLGEALDRLKNAADSMTKPFMEFFTNIAPKAVDAFRHIVDILENNLGPALKTVQREAGQWFDIFIDSAKQVAPVMDDVVRRLSTAFQSLVRAFLPAIQPALLGITRIIEGLGKGLEKWFKPMIPFIKQVSGEFGRFLELLGTELGRISKSLAPTMQPFFKMLMDLTRFAGDFFTAFGKFSKAALKGLYPLQHALLDLLDAVLPLLPPLGRLVAAFAKLLTPVVRAFIPVVENLVEVFGPLIDIFAKVVGWVTGVVEWFLKLKGVTAALTLLVSPLTFAVKGLGWAMDFLEEHTTTVAESLAHDAIPIFKDALKATGAVRHGVLQTGRAMGGLSRAERRAAQSTGIIDRALQDVGKTAPRTGKEVVASFVKQRQHLNAYNRAWANFMRKDPPEELRKSVRAMGIDGIARVKELARLTPGQMDKVAAAIEKPQDPADKSKAAVKGLNQEIGKLKSKTVDITVNFHFNKTGEIPPGVAGGKPIIDFSIPDEYGIGAMGGIIKRPTLLVAGEAGPEALVPLNKLPGVDPLPTGLGGGKPVAMRGKVTFDWRRGLADLEGALAQQDKVRGW